MSFNDDKECDVVVVDNSNKKIYQTTYPSLKEGNSSNNLMIEYAIVSYVTLQNEEEGLFFCSNHDIGAMATTTKFTDFEWLKKFYKVNNIKPNEEFTALFKVIGLERTGLSC